MRLLLVADTLGMLVDGKLNMTWQCALAVQKAILCWAASKGVWPAGRERWFSPSALVRPHLQYRVQLWGQEHKRDVDLLE